jgi:hypothetical protein
LNISALIDRLNFWINKSTGAWYTVPEAIDCIDSGQISLYSDLQPRASTSQRIKDALSPFKEIYTVTTGSNGIVTVPTNQNYLNLLDFQIPVTIGGRTVYQGMEILNEDERADALNSQIDPVDATHPIVEQIGVAEFQIYPAGIYANVKLTFYRRPVAPVMNYTVVGGRNIVYDPTGSVQLEWSEQWHNPILIKSLESIGINLSAADIAQWSDAKSQQNYQSVNMI